MNSTCLLLNTGCLLRVSLQVSSDWTPRAFRVIGVSGVLELTALLVWAAVLLPGLLGRVKRPELTAADRPAGTKG
jgi:hypothetical protein